MRNTHAKITTLPTEWFLLLFSTALWAGRQFRQSPMQLILTLLSMQVILTKAAGFESEQKTSFDFDDHLMAYYPFIDGSTADFSGHSHGGVIVGNVVPSVDINGNPNQAMAFDGSSFITGSSNGFPSITRTISLWFYWTGVGESAAVFAYGGNPCGTSYVMSLNNNALPGTYDVQGHCGEDSLSYSYNSIPTREWHHWVVVSDDVSTNMYVDMALVASNPTNPFGPTNSFAREFSIGVGVSPFTGMSPYTDANSGYFTGILDEIRVYNRAVTQTEIAALYFAHNRQIQNQLNGNAVTAYSFDQGDARDDVNGVYNCTAVGGATIVDGVKGNAFELNGVDGYLDCGSVPVLTNRITVKLWVKYSRVCISCEWGSKIICEDNNSARSWQLSTHYGKFVWHRFGNGDSLDIVSLERIQLDQWYHVVATFDGQRHKLYINSVLNSEIGGSLSHSSSVPLNIGRFGGGGGHLKGMVDEVIISKEPFSELQVRQSYWADLIDAFRLPSSSATASATAAPSSTYSATVSTQPSISVTASPPATPSKTNSAAISASPAITTQVALPSNSNRLSSHVVANYPCDDSLRDASGPHEAPNVYRDGTAYGPVTYSGGPFLGTKSINFNGVNTHALLPTNGINLGDEQYSFSMYFSINDIAKGYQELINTFPHTGISLVYHYSGIPKLTIFLGDCGAGWAFVANSYGGKNNYVQNQWYHMTFVKNGPKYHVYIDGQLDWFAHLSVAPVINCQPQFRLADIQVSGYPNYLDGKISQVTFFKDVAVSAEDIQQLMAPRPFSASPTQLASVSTLFSRTRSASVSASLSNSAIASASASASLSNSAMASALASASLSSSVSASINASPTTKPDDNSNQEKVEKDKKGDQLYPIFITVPVGGVFLMALISYVYNNRRSRNEQKPANGFFGFFRTKVEPELPSEQSIPDTEGSLNSLPSGVTVINSQ